MPGKTQVSDKLNSTAGAAGPAPVTAPVPAVSVASLTLAVAVGSIAGVTGILQEARLLPDALTSEATRFHPVAMLLFVAVPAFLGGFGRLFLSRDLADPTQRNGGLARLPILDALSIGMMTVSLLAFIAGGSAGPAAAAGLLLWSIGAILLATTTVATILDSRAGPGRVAPRGQIGTVRSAPLSLFAWTQFFAAIGLLFAAPVMAASATRAVFAHSGDAGAMLSAFSMPVTLVVLVSAFGLAARIFDSAAPLTARSRLATAALAGVTADGGAVLWARGILTHQTQSTITLAGTCLAAVASLAFAGLWIRALWRQTVPMRNRVGVPVLWVSGFFVFLAAGWGVQMSSGRGLHAAVLSGAVFVLFGAFYNWLETVSEGRYPAGAARLQFGLLFAGAVLSAAGGPVIHGPVQIAGDIAMAASLAVFMIVLAGATRQYGHDTAGQGAALSDSALSHTADAR